MNAQQYPKYVAFSWLWLFVFAGLNARAQKGTIVIPNGNSKTINVVRTDRQGKYTYTVEPSKCIMWESSTGKQLYTFNFSYEADATAMDVSPDGKMLAIIRNGISVYDTFNGTEIKLTRGDYGLYNSTAFINNDELLVLTSDVLIVINIHNNTTRVLAKLSVSFSHSDNKLSLLPNNRVLINNREAANVYDLADGHLINAISYPEGDKPAPGGVKLSLGLTTLPTQGVIMGYTEGGDGYIIDVYTGKKTKLNKANEYDSILPSANTDDIIFCSKRIKGSNSFFLCKAGDFVKNEPLNLTSPLNKYDFAPSGYFDGQNKKVYCIDHKKAMIYDLEKKDITKTFSGIAADWAWFQSKSFDYNRLSGLLNINTDITNLKSIDLFRMVSIRHTNLKTSPDGLAFSTSGDTVAVFTYTTVTLKNVKTNKIIRPAVNVGQLSISWSDLIFFSGNGKFLYYPVDEKDHITEYKMTVATGLKQAIFTAQGFKSIGTNKDKTLLYGLDYGYKFRVATVWNLLTGQKLFTKALGEEAEGSCYVTKDRKKVVVSDTKYYWIYDLATKKVITDHAELGDNGGGIGAITGDNQIYLRWQFDQFYAYDPAGKLLYQFATNTHIIQQVLFSPDEKEFYLFSDDNTVKIWEAATGRYLGVLYLFKDTNDYVFMDAEGRFDGTAGGIKSLYYLQNRQILPLDHLFERYYTPNLYQRLVNNERFDPLPNETINPSPKVKISYAQVVRNLSVVDDKIPTYSNTTGVAEITVNASAENDKVDEIRVFNNGKIINLATRNLIVTNNATGTNSKTYTLNLVPGVNSIRALALNSQRTESEPDEISVRYNAANAPGNIPAPANNLSGIIASIDKNATLHLIVVGINQYKNPKMSLNYALADATAFKDEAERDARTMTANIKTYFITDDKADKAGILQAFKTVQQNAKPMDVLVFYYAGHGVISDKNKEFYLVPNDVIDLKNIDEELAKNGIPSKMLQQYAIDIPAQKQLFILDACQSAGAFATLMTNDANQQKSLALVARSTGTHWIAASGSQQFANEFSQLGHGAFTYVLLQALKGSAKSNNMVTVNGLKNFLQVQVPDLMKKYNGTPQYPASYGLGNDFPVEVIK